MVKNKKNNGNNNNSQEKDNIETISLNKEQNILLTNIFTEIDKNLFKALKERDSSKARDILNSLYNLWKDKNRYISDKDQLYYNTEPDMLEKIREVENAYIIIKFYPFTNKIPNNKIDFQNIKSLIIEELLFGIDEKWDEYKHKGVYLSYLMVEKDNMEQLMNFKPNCIHEPEFNFSGIRLAEKIYNYLSLKIVREKEIVKDPSQQLYNISLKFNLNMVNLGILFELMINRDVLAINRKELRRFASEFFINSHGKLAGYRSMKTCMLMANKKNVDIIDVVTKGNEFFRSLQALQVEKY